jgi:rhodanese-related sulfurtransferase
MSLKSITPAEAHDLIARGAVLIDIREADEHARENIPGAHHLPLSEIRKDNVPAQAKAIVYHCKSGARTKNNAQALREASVCEAYMVEGGLDAWRKAGLPVRVDTKQPLPLNRQVQIGAGALALAGAILGAGLLQAGITGWCGMANLLMLMPWNRRDLPQGKAA